MLGRRHGVGQIGSRHRHASTLLGLSTPTALAALAAFGLGAVCSSATAAPPAMPATIAAAPLPAASDPASGNAIPLYRTRMPPPVTLHYDMQRGLLRGSGELQWRPSADSYALQLDGSIAGFTILRQTSQGGFDASGLAPLRFTDQRLRGPVLAAQFRRDSGLVTFSGSGVELPLQRGIQDRLSWMIQLAAILAADPARVLDGGQVAMPVVGARADPAIWTLRYAGREDIRTAAGVVQALRLERVGRDAGSAAVDVWLDPQHHYLPIRAVLRGDGDAQALELVLHDMVFTP